MLTGYYPVLPKLRIQRRKTDFGLWTLDFGLLLLCCVRMLNELLGAVWRRFPGKLKRWAMTVSHPRFSVTAGAVITDDRGRVLLLKHRFRPGSGWGIPGGYIDKGEQAEDALRRELREEADLELKQVKVLEVRTFKKPQQVEIVFLCRAVGEPEQLNYEIEKAEWFVIDNLPPSLPKDQKELLKRVLRDGARTQD
jgi:8-oxo-dGTP diphosphatase